MIDIGCFSEMKCYADNGSVKTFIVDNIDYNKDKVIKYMETQKRIAGCPKEAIDCITGKTISPSFSVYSDGEFQWCDFLIYHIKKYNIRLPKEFIRKATNY